MMKKCLALLTVLLLLVGFAACGGDDPVQTTGAPTSEPTETTAPATEPTTVPPTELMTDTFPAGTLLGGVDLGGMSVEEGLRALTEAAASYKLVLKVNGSPVTVEGAKIALAVDEAGFERYVEGLRSGVEQTPAVVTYDRAALCSLLAAGLNTGGRNASITYSSAKKQFVASEGVNGVEYDVDAAADGAASAIGMLSSAAEVRVDTKSVSPEITADSTKVKDALSKANGYLKVSLTYTFTPEGKDTSKEAVTTATLASFVTVSDSLEVSVSKSAVESYASGLSSRYSGSDYKGKFKTTGGSTIGYQVTYYGQKVNQSALADDIYKCVTEGTSGTRTAPYKQASDKPYGGSYVEIDLSSQKLWLYKNGERIVSTNLVSGSVAEDCCTPTGVYSIYAKQRDRYLTGADYRSFVKYWMPFLGGYGLHDASWRWSFGGDIYLYDGSHGCVNLPSSAAQTVYNNVEVGTKVILYGGKTEVPDLEQKLTGTTSYTVAENAAPFNLDVKAKYSGATLKYSSSDTSVVKVSSNGTVTVTGVGTATITVTAEAFDFYTGAELKVQITVTAAGETTPPTDPSQPTEPKPTDPPTDPTEPDPTDPPTDPTEPDPTDPPTDPTEPKPTDPPTDPTEPDPTDPPTQPTEPEVTAPPTEETTP